VWSGFAGAPGYSNFSFMDLTTDSARNAAGAAIKAFFDGTASARATTWSVAVQSEITEWDSATGVLTGAANMTSPPAPTAGTATLAPFAGGSGYCVTWKTGLIFNGRRVIGRTFMVPGLSTYDNDGTLSTATISAAQAAATALIAAAGADLAIWAKLFTKPTDGTKPVQIGGALAPVTSHAVKDMASQLRSRRV